MVETLNIKISKTLCVVHMKFCLLSAVDFSGKSFDALVLLNNFVVKIVFNSQRQLVFSILHPVWCRGHCFSLHRPYFALQGPPNSFPTHPQWEWILPVSAKKKFFSIEIYLLLKIITKLSEFWKTSRERINLRCVAWFSFLSFQSRQSWKTWISFLSRQSRQSW